ncbi:ejaculatory bulb-specific protein 3-like isoform X2 [Cydia strobilella]|uniref:ejaculatory bulb-specific protein 3-like isoform X2 n=1 Tax=Cydia strobilella TaxID=1100964 RepID=UPI003007E354
MLKEGFQSRINMKSCVVFACLLAAVFAADKYNSKYDNFDVETLITNDRLLKSYINCFLDKGRCTPEGTDFKKTLPDAVETTCAKCTEKQKGNIKKVIKAIQARHPRQWDELVKKNDPTGKNIANFNKFIES